MGLTFHGHSLNHNIFNPFTAGGRPGLLLLGGAVYAGFASHCDHGPYVGWVAGVNTTTRALHLWTTESLSSTAMGGVWQSGGGLLSDGPGRILFSTGNGATTPFGPDQPVPPERAETVVRIGVNSDGSMSAKDFFAPTDANILDAQDRDLGSGGPAGLPDSLLGTPAHPRLLVELGKADENDTGHVYLLDRDHLGGRGQGPGGGNAVVGDTSIPGFGIWGHPGVWGGNGGYVYFTGANAHLQALKYSVVGGQPKLSLAGQSADTYPFGSGSPVVTSTGTTPGSALVWVIRSNGSRSDLRAYDALPTGTLNLRWSAAAHGTKFTAAKFTVPATDGGRVFVGTRDGHLLAFGLRPGLVAGPSPVAFGAVPVGSNASQTVTIQNQGTTTQTVRATTSPSAPYTVTGLPANGAMIAGGSQVQVHVAFAPTAGGSFNGSFSATSSDGTATSTLTVPLSGSGSQAVPPVDNGVKWQLNGSAALNAPNLVLRHDAVQLTDNSTITY